MWLTQIGLLYQNREPIEEMRKYVLFLRSREGMTAVLGAGEALVPSFWKLKPSLSDHREQIAWLLAFAAWAVRSCCEQF